ncbi:hypothetical protein CAN33_0013970 [Aspergillus niger]|uniref:Sulfite reductase beta subunit n=1 Tax=Aspergillus niger TaxID=5061 RepID=A0A505HU19_ASPNG|nr:hypothetical protein CAN33_0013970 [Aspergillus niger]
MDPSDDPVIASYDICLTDSEISRYVLQYLDRPAGSSYDDRHGQKPTSFRLKPKTGLVEVDVPINTRVNYDVSKGLRYGDALKKSRSAREGGAFGMAGGFSSGGAGGGAPAKVKMEEAADAKSETASLMRVQTLGGRIKSPEDGDPAAEDGEAAQVAGNLDLLKKMQDEKWKDYEWVDAETEESWQLYENYMMHQDVDSLPQLQSAIDSESYLDTMSAPRIDPARPEMTGWAMKQNRMKQREEQQSAQGTTEQG